VDFRASAQRSMLSTLGCEVRRVFLSSAPVHIWALQNPWCSACTVLLRWVPGAHRLCSSGQQHSLPP
jgi:hypothetical protein